MVKSAFETLLINNKTKQKNSTLRFLIFFFFGGFSFWSNLLFAHALFFSMCLAVCARAPVVATLSDEDHSDAFDSSQTFVSSRPFIGALLVSSVASL